MPSRIHTLRAELEWQHILHGIGARKRCCTLHFKLQVLQLRLEMEQSTQAQDWTNPRAINLKGCLGGFHAVQESGIMPDKSMPPEVKSEEDTPGGSGHRVLIFAQLKSYLDIVESDVLAPAGISYLRLDGRYVI